MAAKIWGSQQKVVEEVSFQNEAVSLCLLINRRARTMRVIDFRAGPTSAKRLFVLSLAQREGVEKAYTLVERDEVQTWLKLGFSKEGTIPGFYKRSDAFLLGCLVPAAGRPAQSEAPPRPTAGDTSPFESEMRIAIKAAAGASPAAPSSPSQDLMERTIATAKRELKDPADGPVLQAKIAPVNEVDARRVVAGALRSGRALTAFEPFGRDVQRSYFVATARGGFELHVSTESQGCFGNAFLELLVGPRTATERAGTAATVRAFCEKLQGEGVVTCFSLAPSDDVALAAAFLQNGFRRTGLLLEHLLRAGRRKDAIVWSRKLANPADDL
jgi:hypothetical protein